MKICFCGGLIELRKYGIEKRGDIEVNIEDVMIPTCVECGDQFFNQEIAVKIDEAFKKLTTIKESEVRKNVDVYLSIKKPR